MQRIAICAGWTKSLLVSKRLDRLLPQKSGNLPSLQQYGIMMIRIIAKTSLCRPIFVCFVRAKIFSSTKGVYHVKEEKKKPEKQSKPRRQAGTPYDDAFRSMYARCKKPVLFLLNEAFGTAYDGTEELQFLPNESFLPDDSTDERKQRKRISDSQFEVTDHAGRKRRFQIECQSSDETHMALRVLEYSLTFARDHASRDQLKVRTEIQNIAVLYLRASDSTPDSYIFELVAPNQESISWEVPIVKAARYTLDDLLTNRLYFLLPFHVFAYEGMFEEMEEDADRRKKFVDILDSIMQHIGELHHNGELGSEDAFAIMDNFSIVATALVNRFENLRKDVESYMGRTRDYRTPSQILFDKYREKGRAEGKEIGEFELALAAINDGTGTLEYFKSIGKWSEDKTKRFQIFQKNISKSSGK